MQRLRDAQRDGHFPVQSCELDDLLTISRTAPKGLGAGELSCIAVAYKIQTLAFMTDEKKARKFAQDGLKLGVETTPRLYGFLHFHMHLSDADHKQVVAEHERFEKRPLTEFLDRAYDEGIRCRLAART